MDVLSLEWKSEEVMDDESGESMKPMEEVPFKELGESIGEISAWLMERSRELIPETRGSIGLLEGTICYS